jgi:hypothetical protein
MNVPENISDVCTIPLTRGLFAIVDAEDYPEISKYKWYAVNGRHSGKIAYYAARMLPTQRIDGTKKRPSVFMHNEILGRKDGFFPDHINHNGLDNRRCNLRFATKQQNGANREPNRNSRSKYKGVSYYKNIGPKHWGARIRVNGKRLWLGFFETEIEAAQAYDLAAIEHFGTFAKINEYSSEDLENGKL